MIWHTEKLDGKELFDIFRMWFIISKSLLNRCWPGTGIVAQLRWRRTLVLSEQRQAMLLRIMYNGAS